MLNNRRYKVFLLTFALGVFIWACYFFLIPGYGPILDEWETHNAKFKVRMLRRADLFGYGTYHYIFQSSPDGSSRWRDVMTQLYDEPIPLPKKQVNFVSDEIGTVFMELKYAVTTDGGHTWSVFDFEKSTTFDPLRHNFSRISKVYISPDGSGTLEMHAYDQAKGFPPIFYTQNFGKQWLMK